MRERIQSFDWSQTPLGPRSSWPQSLETTVEIVTESPVPLALLWGPRGILIYNDAYAVLAGSRHPHILGQPVLTGWPEAATFNQRVLDVCLQGGALSFKDQHFVLNRHGSPEDVWMNLDYSPVRDETGAPAGVLAVVAETTARVRAEQAHSETDARFRTLADNISQLAWMADETGYIFWYNKRWLEYTGATLEDMKGWGWRKVHHPDHLGRVVEKITHCFQTGEEWEDIFPLMKYDGEYRWFLSRAMPIRDESGKVVRWFGTNTDITEQRKESERDAQLATIVATSADAIISLSVGGIILSWNPGAERLLGYRAEEVLGKSERMLFADNADKEFEEKYEHLRRGETVSRDTVRRHKDGTLVAVAINAAPMWGPGRRIVGFSAVLRDMTERKRADDHLRVVLRELSHRTKNLLAVIVAMVRQTARTSADVTTLQSQLVQRLQSLSASHDLLVAEDWTGAPVRALVTAVMAPFLGDSSKALDVHGGDVFISATAAQNLGLALHELATNAAKYGALSTPEGRVSVTWAIEAGSDGRPSLRMTWTEHGGPRVEPPGEKGFGHVVVERVVAQALNANVSYDFHRDGVRWSIAVPSEFIVWDRTRREPVSTHTDGDAHARSVATPPGV